MKKLLSVFLTLCLVFTMAFPFCIEGEAMSVITVKAKAQVVDSFNGVDAIYRPGSSDGSNKTYSCAALVKKYYKKVYGVVPYNLNTGCKPQVSGDSFVKVKSPKVGDIVRCSNSSGRSSHWAIVQKVTKTKVVLLEQNWKWRSGGKTYAKSDRSISKTSSSLHFYRLKSQTKSSKKK